VPGAHVTDVARVFRLALEKGKAGARYHAVAEEGVALRDIAEVIGPRLGLPVDSITPEEAPAYFGWLTQLAELDLPASGVLTQQQLGWVPTGPGLLADLRDTDYDAA
jgi:nucleoside-diphosphate-sugar epimerase